MSVFYNVMPNELRGFITDLFVGHGFQKSHAQSVAANLVGADMRNLRSHGVVRVELYLTQQKMGGIRTDAVPQIVRETDTTAVIDAQHAAGAVGGDLATEMAIKKAKERGLGMVTVRNSNHFGGCGYFSETIAKQGMIGIVVSNTAPLMASPITKRAVIGNNPLSIAIPAAKHAPINIDISNGVMAFGKIFEYQRLHKPFPENAWLDENGNPTTDPFANEFIKFISLPIAGHKGYGLAMAVECLTSVLANGVVAGDMLPVPGHSQDENNPVSHMVLAIDIRAFGDLDGFTERVDEFIEYLQHAETREAGMRVIYPGELEGEAIRKAVSEGIDVPENVILLLQKKAEEVSLTFPTEVFHRVER